MGKTDCLAKVYSDTQVKLINTPGEGHNQWTDTNTGNGIIQRIATETAYNSKKGIYDINTELVQLNETFDYDVYDPEEKESIFLWKWGKGGKINVAFK